MANQVDGHLSDHLIEWILENEDVKINMDTIADQLSGDYTTIAFMIWCGVNLYHHMGKTIEEGFLKPDLKHLFNTLVLLILAVNFTFFFRPLSDTIDKVTKSTYSSMRTADRTFVSKLYQKTLHTRKEELGLTDSDVDKLSKDFKNNSSITNFENLEKTVVKNADENIAEKIGTETSWFVESLIGNFWEDMFMMVTFAMGAIIKFVMYMLIAAMDGILYVIGPLACMFSMIPMWKDKFKQWFGTWLVVKMSFITFVLLEQIRGNVITSGQFDSYFGADAPSYVDIGLHVATTVMYTMVFWLTSKFIGSADAGRSLGFVGGFVGSKVLGAAGKLAGGVGKAMKSGGEGGGGGAKGALANIAKGGFGKAKSQPAKK